MLPIWASKICNLEKIDLQRVTAPTTTLLRTKKHNPAIFYNEKLYPMADQLNMRELKLWSKHFLRFPPGWTFRTSTACPDHLFLTLCKESIFLPRWDICLVRKEEYTLSLKYSWTRGRIQCTPFPQLPKEIRPSLKYHKSSPQLIVKIHSERQSGKAFQVSCFTSLSSAKSTQYFHLCRAVKWLMTRYRGRKSCGRSDQILKWSGDVVVQNQQD